MKENNYCVIMAGGIGSRFWPISRKNKPKQFLDMLGVGKTFLQATYQRFLKICLPQNIYIVTNSGYKDIVFEQIPTLQPFQVLLEPHGRNTAPCIAYANFTILKQNPNANIVVAPSDHLILNEEKFLHVAQESLDYVSDKDVLLTLGIKPNRPETGYGYIQIADIENFNNDNQSIFEVVTFTEKPTKEIAEKFYQCGEFFWNSGIFFWNIKTIMAAYDAHLPEINKLFAQNLNVYATPYETEYIKNVYEQCTSISIDYGIMEKVSNVAVYCTEFGWSDLGTWSSLYEHLPKNKDENACNANVLMYDTKNCIVSGKHDKLIAIHGLDGYIVADSENALLICKLEQEQQIRKIVNEAQINKGDKFV